MSFFEYYRLAVPLFFPSMELMLELKISHRVAWRHVPEPALRQDHLPFSPLDEANREAERFWYSLADFYTWPHVQYFDSAQDLAEKLLTTDLAAVSRAMREYSIVLSGEVTAT